MILDFLLRSFNLIPPAVPVRAAPQASPPANPLPQVLTPFSPPPKATNGFAPPPAPAAQGKVTRDTRGRFTPVATVADASDRNWAARQQTTAKAGQIACADILSIVVFDHDARVLQPFVGAFDADFAKSVSALPQQVRGGMTDMAAGLSVAVDLLRNQPSGLLRRIWLLSDGFPTPADQPIDAQVARAISNRININTVGIGNPGDYDRALLERIASGTHNGRFSEADTVSKLDAAFTTGRGPRPVGAHRGEATVFVIDISGSMNNPMGNARRIDAVAGSMLGLLRYKQARWS